MAIRVEGMYAFINLHSLAEAFMLIVCEKCIYCRLACGIIARSAGIFQNFKRICACDGVTIWDEREKPLAGGSRGNF